MHFVVYERHTAGHRENYALTIARILGADVILGRTHRGIWDAFTARCLIITTLESAPRLYTLLALFRAAFGRPTTIIATRSHVPSRGRLQAFARKAAYSSLMSAEPIQLLTISPPEGLEDGRMGFIEDIEFWDLQPDVFEAPPQSKLADRVATMCAGRQVILVTGTLEVSKGLAFLDAIFERDSALLNRFAIVCAGQVMEPSRIQLESLKNKAIVWEDRFLTRDEMLSLYPLADAVWCCYRPDYDVSSGIFGRAVQFGRPTLVRSGSLISRLRARLGPGMAFEYGDTEAAAAALATFEIEPTTARSRYHSASTSLAARIAAHHGSPSRSGD